MEIDRFEFERILLKRGVTRIAGIDEAGRGPLAGPVVAAAVIFPASWIQWGLPEELRGLNDSKQLKPARRVRFFEFLEASSEVRSGVSVVDVAIIDAINILRATHQAMTTALARLEPPPDHVLVDGLQVGAIVLPQTALIGGDARSFTIAAASVVAKVTRDRLMEAHHERYPVYGFDRHKGYGTPQHLAALAEHGPCPLHRRSFAPLKEPENDLFDR